MIEAATSGRSTCKGCKKPIANGELRYGDQVPGNFDGMMTFWYHLPCAVKSRPEQLRDVLAKYKKPLPNRDELVGSLAGASVAARAGRMKAVERAPTGRASCQHCRVVIAKDTIRVAVWTHEMPIGGTGFLHAACAGSWVGSDADAAVIKKAAKKDKASVTAILETVKLLNSDPRGQELERGVQAAKKPAAEISVLADWLEEKGCPVSAVELGQLLAARKKMARKKKK